MSELRRLAYLEALGVDGYVSRAQLPGAATTRRLALVKPAVNTAQTHGVDAGTGRSEVGAQSLLDSLRNSAPQPAKARQAITAPQSTEGQQATEAPLTATPASSGARRSSGVDVPRFSLSVIASGQWLWLEMQSDMPLRSEQVWLVEGMAIALAAAQPGSATAGSPLRSAAKAKVMRFDWPIHNNPQLDEGADAARASLSGFLGRQQQQMGARGVVVMGEAASQWVELNRASMPFVQICSTAEMLESPALKKQAWQALQVLLNP